MTSKPDLETLAKEFDPESLATALYEAYNKSSDGGYFMEKIKKRFCGKVVKDHIPMMKELHTFLVDNRHTVKNPYVYGDIDVGVWYERSPTTTMDIVVVESYCSCANDNTHIFMLRDYSKDFTPEELTRFGRPYQDVKFLAVTAWPRQKKKKKLGHKWGDYRDVVEPSIQTYRKCQFNFGCQDGRDVGYSFKYESTTGMVEDAHWNEPRVMWALRTLRDAHFNAIELEEEMRLNREAQHSPLEV